jgi:hypothetical protein
MMPPFVIRPCHLGKPLSRLTQLPILSKRPIVIALRLHVPTVLMPSQGMPL